MLLDIDDSTRAFIAEHRVARLATADGDGRPSVIPICYVLDRECIYSPLDEKPKRVAESRLKRVRNIEANPHVSLIIDDYSEDWSKLQWVLITGLAEMLLPPGDQSKHVAREHAKGEHAKAVALLRSKYPQYHSMAIDERMIIKITPTRIRRWGAR